jgi:hypothetical protein
MHGKKVPVRFYQLENSITAILDFPMRFRNLRDITEIDKPAIRMCRDDNEIELIAIL